MEYTLAVLGWFALLGILVYWRWRVVNRPKPLTQHDVWARVAVHMAKAARGR